MSDPSSIRTGIVALFCVFIAVTQVLLLAQSGDPSQVIARSDADLEIHRREVQALLREIRDGLRAGGPSAEFDRTGQAEESTGPSRMDASAVPFDAGLVDRLEAALSRFSANVEQMAEDRAPQIGLRSAFESSPEKPQVPGRSRYADRSEAKKHLLFRSYREALKLLGRPDLVSISERGVAWQWVGFVSLIFVDGVVMEVHWRGN